MSSTAQHSTAQEDEADGIRLLVQLARRSNAGTATPPWPTQRFKVCMSPSSLGSLGPGHALHIGPSAHAGSSLPPTPRHLIALPHVPTARLSPSPSLCPSLFSSPRPSSHPIPSHLSLLRFLSLPLSPPSRSLLPPAAASASSTCSPSLDQLTLRLICLCVCVVCCVRARQSRRSTTSTTTTRLSTKKNSPTHASSIGLPALDPVTACSCLHLHTPPKKISSVFRRRFPRSFRAPGPAFPPSCCHLHLLLPAPPPSANSRGRSDYKTLLIAPTALPIGRFSIQTHTRFHLTIPISYDP